MTESEGSALLRIEFQTEAGGRLDALLAAWLTSNPVPGRAFSRTQLADWIREGHASINAKVMTKASAKAGAGDTIALEIPAPRVIALTPEKHDLEFLYVDEHLIVLNKPAGLRVHPTPEDLPGSLVSAILGHDLTLAPAGGALRPGVVHRLDKTTSGVMVLARTDTAYFALVEQFKARTITKRYLALTAGHLPHHAGLIDAPLGRHPEARKKFAVRADGKPAQTGFTVLERFPVADLVELELFTGRTHQIRVHLAHRGAAVLGDQTYGGGIAPALVHRLTTLADAYDISEPRARAAVQRIGGQLRDYPGNCLHAQVLGLRHPVTGEALEFEAATPPVWVAILTELHALWESVEED